MHENVSKFRSAREKYQAEVLMVAEGEGVEPAAEPAAEPAEKPAPKSKRKGKGKK